MGRFVIHTTRFLDDSGREMSGYQFDAVDPDILDLPWLHGVSFAQPTPTLIEMQIETDDQYAGFFPDFASGSLPLMSDRLRQAFEAAGVDNIQFFEVTVANADRFTDVPTYWAFNVVGRVAVSDPGKSRGERAFGRHGATLFSDFQAHAELEEAPACFRSVERASTVVVSDSVRKACAALDIDTVEFTPVETWFS